MEAVQGELSKYVVDFAPNGSTQAQIPFMTTAESLGSRDVIAEGTLESSGAFHVEESSLESGVVRRLIFAANTNVIQTEVRLVAKSNQPAKKNKGGGGKKTSGKKKGNKGKGGNSAAGDGDYLAMVPDPTYLCFDYHRAMLAALSLLPAASLKDSTGVIVGLGGGALPMAMQSFAPTMALTCLELDAEVVKVASKFFGFREDSKVSVAVADGLAYDYGTNTHGLICLDVDSKDVSLGISCPPPAFLEASFLSKVKSALLEDGILVVNLSARSSELLKGALDAIKGAFSNGRVFTIMPSEDDVNLIVIAVNGMSVALPKVQATASVAEAQKKRAGDTSSLSGVLRSRVREWLLEVPDMRTDPMGLMELAEALKEITANLV
jgi:spermidine synthase